MASAANRCRNRSRPSSAVQRPSGPWTRLATTRWVCSSGSPSLDVRWSNPTARTPCPTRAGHRHVHGGRPGARPGSRPPQPRQHDGRPARLVRWPDRPSHRGSRHSWSAAARRRRRARRCGRGVGRAARRCRGGGPRTWPGTRPPMLRPAGPGWWRRRRTSGLGTRRGQTGTVRGRWPAPGCNTPPGPPRAWRCRHHPAAPSPPSLARANAPVVHCSPQTITGRG